MMIDTRYSVLNSFSKYPLLAALLLAACVGGRERARRAPDPHLSRVVPNETIAGEPFQVQPDGAAALVVEGTNLRAGMRVRFGGRVLESSGGEGRISAIVPRELYIEPGMFPVTVEAPEGVVSNSLPFHVVAATGPAPVIGNLYPSEFAAGKPFNVQPDGQSALGIAGERFIPGAVVEIDGEEQISSYGGATSMSAIVPAKFLSRPGRLKIVVRNRDGKRSQPAELILR
jgi:hypothetical protein